MRIYSKLACFIGGVLFGSVGIKLLSSKDALIAIMPNPTVVTNLTGGHLALMVRLERYAELVTEYIRERI